MREAGVNLVTVGVFSWALLEPRPASSRSAGSTTCIDLLHGGGHRGRPRHRDRVAAAVARPAPPGDASGRAGRHHPVAGRPAGVLPELAGLPGARAAAVPGHGRAVRRPRRPGPVARLQRAGLPQRALLLRRERRRPSGTGWCARYGDVDRLNDAWGTAFWSQHYGAFDEVLPPRAAPAFPNPTQQLDFRRFSSDQLLANFVAERDVLHELSPGVPVTTNFMVMAGTARDGLLRLGARGGPGLQRPLPHGGRPRGAPRAGVLRRPDPRRRRRPARGC